MAAIRSLQVEDNKHGYSFVTTQDASDAIQTGQDKDFGFFIKAASLDRAMPLIPFTGLLSMFIKTHLQE